MADVMRLVVEAQPVVIANGLSTSDTISTDDNSNNSHLAGNKSLTQCNEKWARENTLNEEEEYNNYKNWNSIRKTHISNSNQQESNYDPSKLQPLPLVAEIGGQNQLETPSSAISSPGDSSCCESSDSEEEKPKLTRNSFANPNYPGFQHLAYELNDSFNNNNNNVVEKDSAKHTAVNININLKNVDKETDSINQLNRKEGPKEIYSRPKFNIPLEEKEMNCETELLRPLTATTPPKSSTDSPAKLSSPVSTKPHKSTSSPPPLLKSQPAQSPPKFDSAEEIDEAEKGEGDTKKREKTVLNTSTKPSEKDGFDVYNIETALPKIDLEAIETHLRAAKEEERRRRNDREEIRRRLATGSDNDEYFNSSDKPGKKPSLQARLQSGMNLQICFMNETSSDTDSPSSESAPPSRSGTPSAAPSPPKSNGHPEPPKSLNLSSKARESKTTFTPCGANEDFFTRQARLQAEARLALSQARDRARLQMEADRLSGKTSPITEMLRASLKKVGVHFPPERRRVSRQMLTDMNVAQLQVLVNDLHTQIENLNEGLVKYLMERDELHMTQDSTLVDIEDVTRYLGAKESCLLKDDIARNNNLAPPVSSSKPVITRIVSLGGAKK
ncbi:Schwannomin-interacting protein 1 [Nesidiocoris tenuis]|uniref:Schwannomin-interacting protein 1 n=1 Tax=Nesidiocoris tenuis TaxID=355587 RepID=A0ABN7AD72_9HEMI|nr:Schwannomin-interacting protein 1 [Nesidiocoris tenuis]